MSCKRLECHCRGTLFALTTVAGYVRRCNERFAEQVAVDGGLAFPAVDGGTFYRLANGSRKRRIVDHFAA